MSAWATAVSPAFPLSGAEGALVSVRVSVDPSRLEALLDALAHLDFPINPQLHHEAKPETVVEFPAYENHLPEIRDVLEACGFPAKSVETTPMLDSIRGH